MITKFIEGFTPGGRTVKTVYVQHVACHAVYVLIARSRCIPKGATMVACFSFGRPWDRIPGLREDSILQSTPLG